MAGFSISAVVFVAQLVDDSSHGSTTALGSVNFVDLTLSSVKNTP